MHQEYAILPLVIPKFVKIHPVRSRPPQDGRSRAFGGAASNGIKNGKLPATPGVYLMKDETGKILYVGKAVNLKRRLEGHFMRPHGRHIEIMVSSIHRIDYEELKNGLEALIREAALIKLHHPPYNISEQDDKSFLYVRITREEFPRVLTVRGKDRSDPKQPSFTKEFGPFVHGGQLKEALKILRRIFPYSTHAAGEIPGKRPCFEYEIKLCPGTCCGVITKEEYRKNIKRLISIFEGKRNVVVRDLRKEMKGVAKNLEFEKAQELKRALFSLEHIKDTAFINTDEIKIPGERREKYRIEGYDISNISGTSAVGSMVVFENGEPNKSEYRKFGIKTVRGSNDTAMLREVIARRLGNPWPLPELFLIDGGAPQVNAVIKVLKKNHANIPVVGIAKGPERKRNDIIGVLPGEVSLQTAIRVRDEAHRFAISFHKHRRAKSFLPKQL